MGIKVVITFLFLVCLSGCASTSVHSWRDYRTKVEPFPAWAITEINGDFYPQILHTHYLEKESELLFPAGYRWGVNYEVIAFFKPAKSRPKLADYVSTDTYVVKEIVAERPVESGQCFVLSGSAPNIVKEKLSVKRFLELFKPNSASFKNSTQEMKLEKFLEDQKAIWFSVQGCFENDLQIVFNDIRYDH